MTDGQTYITSVDWCYNNVKNVRNSILSSPTRNLQIAKISIMFSNLFSFEIRVWMGGIRNSSIGNPNGREIHICDCNLSMKTWVSNTHENHKRKFWRCKHFGKVHIIGSKWLILGIINPFLPNFFLFQFFFCRVI